MVPIQVLRTILAEKQIQSLRNRDRTSFRNFAHDLHLRGCAALGYRLTGPHPIAGICVKHLVGTLRVAVGFISHDQALIITLGHHDRTNPEVDVYAALYELLSVTPPDDTKRDKPPCCDLDTGRPAELGDGYEELLDRARRLGRRR